MIASWAKVLHRLESGEVAVKRHNSACVFASNGGDHSISDKIARGIGFITKMAQQREMPGATGYF